MSGPASPPRMSLMQSVLMGVMQRFWRASRGLRLRAEAIVVSSQGRVLVTSEGRLPGVAVPKGQGAEDALMAELHSLFGVSPPAPSLLAVLVAPEAEPRATTTTHIALFEARLDADLAPQSGSYTFVEPETLEGCLAPEIFTFLRRRIALRP